MPTVEVGLFAHNEQATLQAALDALLDQRLPEGGPRLVGVTVVSCGSTDSTDRIALRVERRDPRVKLLSRAKRRGKASAINAFLASARADFVVLASADVVLAEGALERLLAPFADAGVGMTGVRPVPLDERRGIGALTQLLWELHDRVARERPKLGEVIALRAPVRPLPEWTRADEATLEADVTERRGLELRYCPDAVAYNRGPTRWSDYLEHRTRIAAAHVETERLGYRPATRHVRALLRHGIAQARSRPSDVGWLALAALLEGWCWGRGLLRARAVSELRGDGTWQPIASAKRPITRPESRVAAESHVATESRVAAE